jgi:hypothetical protein
MPRENGWDEAGCAEPDPVANLCRTIRVLAEREVDPHVLVGALIEGAAFTAGRSVVPEQHRVVGAAMLSLLADRLRAHGLIQPLDLPAPPSVG